MDITLTWLLNWHQQTWYFHSCFTGYSRHYIDMLFIFIRNDGLKFGRGNNSGYYLNSVVSLAI